ncbi:MAG: NADH-quinone oxidoreductase subunit NuoE [Deltaproteobacteria bacterium]|nr:NADH-quinone oxidoreductase subunit NuoE [Deltaproteobacteria bacterium]
MKPTEMNWEKFSEIIQNNQTKKWGLIPLLQKVQESFGYVPPETIEPIAESLNLYPSEVQGVLTFYAGFSTEPKGKYVLKVCRGTACHVKGGKSILRLIQKDLDLDEGETSPDYQFTLETAACLGACFLAPAMMVDREYYGKLNPIKVTSILGEHRKEKGED